MNRNCEVSFFFGGGGGRSEVSNSYNHVFGRDGINYRKRYSISERLAYKKEVF